ncbi:hypothetical protein ES705_21897 [subsurface metagenome]|jgi:transcriptional regulator with XRE-family HTH domain
MQEKKFKKIGARIKKLREEKNWTQPVLASKVGASQSYIADLENGYCKPAHPILIALSDVFCVPVPDIYPDIDIDIDFEKRGREFLKE